MITILIIINTPWQKDFSCYVDRILTFLNTTFISTELSHSAFTAISTYCLLALVVCSLLYHMLKEKSWIQRWSTAWSFHLQTMKVALEQAFPCCCSKMHITRELTCVMYWMCNLPNSWKLSLSALWPVNKGVKYTLSIHYYSSGKKKSISRGRIRKGKLLYCQTFLPHRFYYTFITAN